MSQVLVAGLALGARFEASRRIRIVEKEVVKLVVVPAPAKSPGLPEAVVAHPPLPTPGPEVPAAAALPPDAAAPPQFAR